MSHELVTTKNRTPPATLEGPHQVVPATVADAGEAAAYRFFEFFTARIPNPNTRRAYYGAACRFFAWAEERGLPLAEIRPPHVALYMQELLANDKGKTTVKLVLSALRGLFDYLVVGQVVPFNPVAAVRGPKHVVKRGTTPVLNDDEMRQLFESIDTSHVVGLRDRALIGLMFYSFARIGAAVSMRVEDYFPKSKRWWVRLHEKGGKHHEMPAHHLLEEYLDAYIEAAKIADDKKGPLFRTVQGKTKKLTTRAMTENDAWHMVQRRAKDAGIETAISCHSFRASGITNYRRRGGSLEKAQQMAAHESAKTTRLYDRSEDPITLDEVERISLSG